MRIVVVRHGQAEPKKTWTGPDLTRPLVARGRRQAMRLDKVVGGQPPRRVISSPALRCVQTVQPLADRFGAPVEVSDDLLPQAGMAAEELCRRLASTEPDDSTVLLCAHREVIVELLPRLAKEYGGKLGHRLPGAKGGAWVLRWRAGRLVKFDYRPPAA